VEGGVVRGELEETAGNVMRKKRSWGVLLSQCGEVLGCAFESVWGGLGVCF
jgi:hypothetical protein